MEEEIQKPTEPEEQPPLAPEVPSPPKKKRGKWIVLLILVIVVIAIIAVAASNLPAPTAPGGNDDLGNDLGISESEYFGELADIFTDASGSLIRYSGVISIWDPFYNDDYVLGEMQNEIDIMKSLRTRLILLDKPCAAMNTLHSLIVGAFDKYIDGMELGYDGLYNIDGDIIGEGLVKIEEGNSLLDSADDELNSLLVTIPNC